MDNLKDNRLDRIKDILKESNKPINGTELAKQLNVSRQIIVQDIGLLRAQNVPIVSTNRGYSLVDSKRPSRTFKVHHKDEDIERELNLLVDMGVTVEDVFVRHRIYGVISAEMNIKSRKDVAKFLDDIENSVSTPLKHITNDYHFHKVTADDEETLDLVEKILKEEGFLV